MVVTVISPLLKISSFRIGSQFVTRNQFGFTFLRYQYTLSISKNLSFKYENTDKKGMDSLKRTTCTLQGYQYNPYLDVMKFQNKKIKKIVKYLSMPRVENVTRMNLHELNMQIFFNGYKPLPFITKQSISDVEYKRRSNTSNNTTMLEVSLDLNNYLSNVIYNNNRNIWMNSAAGLESYDEWKNIPLDMINRLKPYVPPYNLQNNNMSNTRLDTLDIHKIDPHGLLKQLCDVIFKTYKKGKK